ncbi:MAG: hypothetical protein M4579_000616 [Chaenotheca gracillima]|nr:MAG: hypothetical protein M4579_000616 [Chaenotheca gracillima]
MSAPGNLERGISGRWGRLKNVTIDPLEEMGLPSKGDRRLLDFSTQDMYFNTIRKRYMKFCASSGGGPQLENLFSSLFISANTGLADECDDLAKDPNDQSSSKTPGPYVEDRATERELSTLLMAMRKLREAIVASNRLDRFSINVYVYSIRASILAKHVESYHPALLHLLRALHPASPQSLSRSDYRELTGYLVLDLACRQQDFAAAYSVRRALAHDRPPFDAAQEQPPLYAGTGRVDAILRAMVHDDYHLFWRMKQGVDGYQARLMEFAEEGMTRVALKCLGRTYLNVEKSFVVKVTGGKTWEELKEKYEVGWELKGAMVIIRKPRGR